MTADLVRAAQQGDHAAFEKLIATAYDRLYAVAYRILRGREAAEDATQDAIVRCWRDIRGLREPDRFEAWLHRLLVNACRDLARHDRRRPQEVFGTSLESTATTDDYGRVADHDELERLHPPAGNSVAPSARFRGGSSLPPRFCAASA